ncbi:MAG: Flp family type IVb pilin [Rhodobacteraceae bacterium]|nr:Flp family type IVb pilin [Paracoccaceae bacterium]
MLIYGKKTKIFLMLARLTRDERGVTLVEYGIGITIAVFIGTGVFFTVLGGDISGAMGAAGAAMPN